MILNIMVGIPGSGKSYYITKNSKVEDIVICPDQIRWEVTGDISDQSQNKKVWEVAYERLSKADRDTWFDATNISEKSLRNILQNASQFKKVNIFITKDSTKKLLCIDRIKKDISEHKFRSNVPDYIVDNMFERFQTFVSCLSTIKDNLKKDFKNVNLIKFI